MENFNLCANKECIEPHEWNLYKFREAELDIEKISICLCVYCFYDFQFVAKNTRHYLFYANEANAVQKEMGKLH